MKPVIKLLYSQRAKDNFAANCLQTLKFEVTAFTIAMVLIAALSVGLAWGLRNGRSWAWINSLSVWIAMGAQKCRLPDKVVNNTNQGTAHLRRSSLIF